MAQNNLAVLQTYLKDIIFTETEITASVENREHIFEIKYQESTLGFISLYDLKAYVFEHEEEAKNYFVRNIDSDDWKNIYEHPFFQRRKPQLISTENLKDADDLEFFILQKGQKNGPYEKHELMEKIENKEILLTDMASFNGGHTWMKLFQIDGFDRRSLKESDQLPGMPSADFLQRPIDEVHSLGETTEAISSLAFLGNLKRGKAIERDREMFYQDEMTKKATSSSIYKWLLVGSVIGICYFLYSIKSHLSSPFGPAPTALVGEQAEMLTPVEETNSSNRPLNFNNNINDQRRNGGKFESRTLTPVRQAMPRKSFMNSRKFQDANKNNDNGPTTNDDTNYYFDNASPMEIDPVRAQISKENYDNGGVPAEPGPAPDNDTLFNQEISN